MAVSFKNISCTEVLNKEDYYDVVVETYKEKFTGRFERSQLRHMIEIFDNAINVGMIEEKKEENI